MKVVTYSRVSGKELKINNEGLLKQANLLDDYCDTKGYTILGTFSECGSSKDKKRPEFNAMLKFAIEKKANKILVTDLDRLARGITELTGLIRYAESFGIEIQTINQDGY